MLEKQQKRETAIKQRCPNMKEGVRILQMAEPRENFYGPIEGAWEITIITWNGVFKKAIFAKYQGGGPGFPLMHW